MHVGPYFHSIGYALFQVVERGKEGNFILCAGERDAYFDRGSSLRGKMGQTIMRMVGGGLMMLIKARVNQIRVGVDSLNKDGNYVEPVEVELKVGTMTLRRQT